MKMLFWRTKVLKQILKNQQHILYEFGSMHANGKINTGIYAVDTISEKLRKESEELRKAID